jgi:hypothetical protein
MRLQFHILDMLIGTALLAVALGLLRLGIASHNLWALHFALPFSGGAVMYPWLRRSQWRAATGSLCILAWLLFISLYAAPLIWLNTMGRSVNPLAVFYVGHVHKYLFWAALFPVTITLVITGLVSWCRRSQRRILLVVLLGTIPWVAQYLMEVLGIISP